jgi:hypothetical protein
MWQPLQKIKPSKMIRNFVRSHQLLVFLETQKGLDWLLNKDKVSESR